jgi:hypothetical protein
LARGRFSGGGRGGGRQIAGSVFINAEIEVGAFHANVGEGKWSSHEVRQAQICIEPAKGQKWDPGCRHRTQFGAFEIRPERKEVVTETLRVKLHAVMVAEVSPQLFKDEVLGWRCVE